MSCRAAVCAVLALFCAVGSAGCRSSDHDDAGEQKAVALRVSATAGLSEFVPGAFNRGSTAAAIDLVFDPSHQHLDVVLQRGEELTLAVNPDSELSANDIARGLVFNELRDVRVEGDRLIVRFSGAGAATRFAMGLGGVRVGPFDVVDPSSRPLVLEARGEGTIDVIELHEVSKSDEWRMLLGRQLDVIPMADDTQRAVFEDTDTVRLVDMESRAEAAVFFNVRTSKLADRETRRALAGAIDRAAIANVVCRSAACQLDAGNIPDGQIPDNLDILVLRGESISVLVAEVVQSQLREVGVKSTVTPVSIDDLYQRALRGDFELAISPLGGGPLRYEIFVSPPDDGGSYTGYSNPRYDAAVEAGDFETAERILDHEVLFTPLYRMGTFAAIDSRWCGDVKPTTSSWRWLADLRPCEPGETP